MITPSFSVTQDEEFVFIEIKAPYIKAQNIEMHVADETFIFSLKPYYLRLRFPANLVEDDRAHASYDVSAGVISIKLPKENKGEHFPDLDLISRLLARSGEAGPTTAPEARVQPPLIQVMDDGSSENAGDMVVDAQNDLALASEFDWELPQEVAPDVSELLHAKYGFNLMYQGHFTYAQETANDINEIMEPEKSTAESRKNERLMKEEVKFDEAYYQTDFVHTEEIDECIKWKSPAWTALRELQKAEKAESEDPQASPPEITFDEKETEALLRLPRREYIISDPRSLYLCLIPLLFAHAYDTRTTLNDPTPESAWTIGKLSPTIACLDSSFQSIHEVIVACTRRALCYPLYRNWKLVEKCWEDVYCALRLGKRWVLRCLLGVRERFEWHDVYYIYNKIIVEDYCVWIQSANDNVIRTLAHEVRHCTLAKSEMGWDLEEMESKTTQ
ncbi:hypothetical protein YB2330_002954 [Saitoella coloradoensis]